MVDVFVVRSDVVRDFSLPRGTLQGGLTTDSLTLLRHNGRSSDGVTRRRRRRRESGEKANTAAS